MEGIDYLNPSGIQAYERPEPPKPKTDKEEEKEEEEE